MILATAEHAVVGAVLISLLVAVLAGAVLYVLQPTRGYAGAAAVLVLVVMLLLLLL